VLLKLTRRLLLGVLVVVIGCALAALTPPVALLSWAFSLLRRRDQDCPGQMHHSRLLRMLILGLTWVAGETAALAAFLGLWLVNGFGGRLNTEPYQARNYAVVARFLDQVYRVALRVCALTVTVTAPPDADELGDRPVIVLSRHAGPADSLLLVHYLLSDCQRHPRVVMKATLQLDPTVDIMASRLPNAFLARVKNSPVPSTGIHGTRQRTEQIRRLAAGMGARSALVLFPEGGNWTPLRWQRGIERLRRRGRPDLAERAAAMPNLLPPHGSGALTAIAACPEADVVFVAHTGLDRLVGVRDVWRSLHFDLTVRARWWRVPAADVPPPASPDAQLTWLYDWWERIDDWITTENPARPEEQPEPLPSA
jgi:1-acyl-sn-glycerol-3-phosphate acyltransferase